MALISTPIVSLAAAGVLWLSGHLVGVAPSGVGVPHAPAIDGGFAPFTAQHVAAVVGLVIAIAVSLSVGLRLRGSAPSRLRTIEIAVGGVAFIVWLYMTAWYLHPTNFEASASLPLHLCDLAMGLVPISLIFVWRAPRVLLYYWGLGFSSQAFITPTLERGPESPAFWLFWISHGLIVATAIYHLVVSRLRPTWRDLRRATAITLFWFFTVLILVNIPFGYNYGFSGRTVPGNPTVIDFLGPWPWRLLPLIMIGIGGMVLLTVPWTLPARGRPTPETCV